MSIEEAARDIIDDIADTMPEDCKCLESLLEILSDPEMLLYLNIWPYAHVIDVAQDIIKERLNRGDTYL